MDVSDFSQLLTTLMTDASQGRKLLRACISKPSPALVQLYGPMTDKIIKDKSIVKANELYERYMKSRNGGFMWQAVDQLAISIAETNIQATNGGIGILSTIIEIQRESFNA